MADAVAIRSNVPSMAGDSLEEMEAVLSLPTDPPSLRASTRPRDNHQPRRIDADITTENSFVRDEDRDVSKSIIKYDVLEDRADDRVDDNTDHDDDADNDDASDDDDGDDYDDQEEEEFSNPLARVTPRSISRRSTEVSIPKTIVKIFLAFYINIILYYIILNFLVCRQCVNPETIDMRGSGAVHARCCEHAASNYAISVQLSSLLCETGRPPLAV
jgi:hypothetical protein